MEHLAEHPGMSNNMLKCVEHVFFVVDVAEHPKMFSNMLKSVANCLNMFLNMWPIIPGCLIVLYMSGQTFKTRSKHLVKHAGMFKTTLKWLGQ